MKYGKVALVAALFLSGLTPACRAEDSLTLRKKEPKKDVQDLNAALPESWLHPGKFKPYRAPEWLADSWNFVPGSRLYYEGIVRGTLLRKNSPGDPGNPRELHSVNDESAVRDEFASGPGKPFVLKPQPGEHPPGDDVFERYAPKTEEVGKSGSQPQILVAK